MAKGRIVTDSVRVLIAQTKNKHPKWTAKEVRNEVEHLLRQRDETLPKGWPGLSVVQRTLADMKRNAETPSPLDGPWHLASLDAYPIAHAAIPAVLEVWKLRITRAQAIADLAPQGTVGPKAYRPTTSSDEAILENIRKMRRKAHECYAMGKGLHKQQLQLEADGIMLLDARKKLTIREAKWAARLCGVVKDTKRLSTWAAEYADAERLYESIGRPFYSGFADAELMGFSVAWGAKLPFTEPFTIPTRLGDPAEAKGWPVHPSLLTWEPPAPKRTRKGGK